MKNIVILFALIFSLEGKAAVHNYWIENSFCGEADPFILGDVCVLEIANQKEHLVIITDFTLTDVTGVSEGDLNDMDVSLDKKHLKRATKKMVEALDGFAPKNVPVYTIDLGLIQVLNIQDDQD